MLSVTLVVLNWNNAPDTLECLHSLALTTYPNLQVIVVDNGSSDASVPVLRQQFPTLALIETGTNLGYAGGNNVGLRHALAQGAEFIGILNNDTVVDPGFLEPLLTACGAGPAPAVTTPLICEYGRRDVIWSLGARIDWRVGGTTRLHAGEPRAAYAGAAPCEVDSISGTAFLAPRQVFETAGLLDERFFLYYEETDWCLRARDAGYAMRAVPAAVVWHKVSASLGQSSPMTDYYMLRNQLLFISRHRRGWSRRRLLARAVLTNLCTVLAYTLKPHGGQRRPHRDARLLALRDFLRGRYGPLGPDVAAACQAKPR